MASAHEQVRAEIEALVKEGEGIGLLETAKHMLREDREAKVPEGIKKGLKDFRLTQSYQDWYSKALPVVEQLLPDRLAEFVEAYKPAKPPKALDVLSYGISHYLVGITLTRLGEQVFDIYGVFQSRLDLQIQIVRSAQTRIDSRLKDIQGHARGGAIR